MPRASTMKHGRRSNAAKDHNRRFGRVGRMVGPVGPLTRIGQENAQTISFAMRARLVGTTTPRPLRQAGSNQRLSALAGQAVGQRLRPGLFRRQDALRPSIGLDDRPWSYSEGHVRLPSLRCAFLREPRPSVSRHPRRQHGRPRRKKATAESGVGGPSQGAVTWLTEYSSSRNFVAEGSTLIWRVLHICVDIE